MPAFAAVALGCWVVLELAVRVRETLQGKGGRARDRGTRVLIALTLAGAIGLAAATAPAAPTLPAAVRVLGVIVMFLGLATRVWAIAALGAAFRTTVEVDPGQGVVTRGPYARIRHPSYTGLLLIVVGFGLAVGNWLSLVLCLLLPLPAVLWRIRVEEAELERVLGDAYGEYRARTTRLIPGPRRGSDSER